MTNPNESKYVIDQSLASESNRNDDRVNDDLLPQQNEQQQQQPKKKEKSTESTSPSILKRFKGPIYVLLSSFLFSLSTIAIRKVKIMNASDLTLLRYVLQLILMSEIIKKKNLTYFGPRKARLALAARGSLGSVALFGILISSQLIDPSDSKALYNTSFLLTALLSRLILKEKFNLSHLISTVFIVAGVILITQPSFIFTKPPKMVATNLTSLIVTNQTSPSPSSTTTVYGSNVKLNTILGFLISSVAAVAGSFVPILLKQIANMKIHYSIPSIYVNYFGIPLTLLVSVLLTFFAKSSRNFDSIKLDDATCPCGYKINVNELSVQLFIAIGSAIVGVVSQIFWNLAIEADDVTKISILSQSDLLFIFLQQYFILQIKSNIPNIVGAFCIFMGTFIILVFQMFEKNYRAKIDNKNRGEEEEENNLDDENREATRKKSKPNLFTRIIFFKF